MTTDPLHAAEEPRGGDLLARISNEMVKAQKRYFGKGPTQAKSYLVDDLLFIVMRGGLTTGERTMVEFEQQDAVRQFRQTFQNEMAGLLAAMVEELTGRKVLTYQSQVMFDPDIVVEMFVFDEPGPAELRQATSEAQLEGDGAGEATARDALDPPSDSGQSAQD